MSYESFLIADFKIGLELDREPWLLPKDAFKTLTNAYLHEGVLKKREGYAEFFDTLSSLPITGFIVHTSDVTGEKTLLTTTTKRLYSYISGTLTDEDAADVLTGNADDFLHGICWKGTSYMTNNADRPRTFTGGTVANMTIDLDGDASNDVTAVAFIAVLKERLILFRNTENTTLYPQRARWSTAGDATNWTNDEYSDCPTGEWIRAVGYMGDDIVVWFDDSVWLFKYTSDSTLPFRWEKLNEDVGCVASFSHVKINGRSIVIDKSEVVATDGFTADRIDQILPDYILNFDPANVTYCFGGLNHKFKKIWFLYPYIGSSASDRCLVMDYENGDWANFEITLACLGEFTTAATTTWATATGTWADQTDKWVEGSNQAGYPNFLGGSANGKVYKLNTGKDDDGTAINYEVETGEWNPYKDKGNAARLGYIDFLVSSSDVDSLTVDFFTDFNTVSYQSKTLSFDGAGGKVWKRVYSGAVGDSHRIKLSQNTTGQQPGIHAIMPAFKPAGRLI